MKTKQPLSAKIGEVVFRRKTILQFKGEKVFFKNYLHAEEVLEDFRKKSQNTRLVFEKLKKRQIPLSPFVDLGAGVCCRTAVLTTKFKSKGFALDLSAESLESASFFCPSLGLGKLPIRICADISCLPFDDSSLPFVCIFQTLHHFPDPLPPLKEINRVLSPGGFLYIGEEPVRRWLHFSLWRRDGYHLRWWEKVLKVFIILHFISSPGRSEVSDRVLEETFTFSAWQKALDQFAKVEVEFIPFPFGPHSKIKKSQNPNWFKPSLLTKIWIGLVGGGINSLCKKEGSLKTSGKKFWDFLICPDCHKPIERKGNFLFCQNCLRSFPKIKGVYYLLPKPLAKKLYPDISISR